MFSTRTRSLVAGLAALGVVAGAPAAHAAIPRAELATSPEVTTAQPTVEPTVSTDPDVPSESVTPEAPETTDVPDAPATDAARTVGPTGVDTPPPHVATDTTQALEVDGVPGGYSRQKCERLAQQWEEQVDKAMENVAGSGGFGPQLQSAMSQLQHAQETYDDMSDNCLVVDPQ